MNFDFITRLIHDYLCPLVKKTTRAHLAVLGTNLFFAGNFSMVKMIAPALVGAFGLNVLRTGGSLLLFWLVWLFGGKRAGFDRSDWGRFLLCAFTGVAVNQMLFLKGLTLTSISHASLLMLVTPLFVTLFALWMLKESFSIFKAIGLALGIGGATFLILQKETSNEASDYLLGDLLIIINAISYSFYFVLVKPLMEKYGSLHVIRWVFTLGMVMILPFGWTETISVEWPQWQWEHIAALAFIVIAGTFLAYFFNAYGIQHIGAGATGTYIYTQPVFAVIIAILFFDEQISWQKILAAVFIFSGVFLVNLRRNKG